MRLFLALVALLLIVRTSACGENNGLGVGVRATVVSRAGPTPQIVSTLPPDGGSTNTATPILRVVFNIDMDTSKTDITKIVLPTGLTVTQLVWADPRTLNILYNGSLPGFGAKRVDLLDRYFVTPLNAFIPLGSGYAFTYGVVAGNMPPIIAVAASAVRNPAGLGDAVAFSVIAVDPDNDPLTFNWNFGDASNTVGANVSHAYAAAGVFTATVVVTDGNGGSAQSQVTVNVINGGGAPIVLTTEPADGSTVTTGRPDLTIHFNVDMDTSKTDVTKIVLPSPLMIGGLVWTDSRTLRIAYLNGLDSFGAKRVDLKDMYFVNSANQPIPTGSGYAFNFQSANNAPIIVQAPSANPAIAVPGTPITFTVQATDADNDVLTYTWDFGDGTSGLGQTLTHTYATNGPFIATVVVTDGNGGIANSSVLVSAGATPGGETWTITRAIIGLNFKLAGKDKMTVAGTVELPAGFDPTNKNVSVNAGGNVMTFKLDSKGRAKVGTSSFKLTRKLKKKVFIGGAVKIQFTLMGSLAAQLADEKLTNADTPKGGVRTSMDVTLVIDNSSFNATRPLLYNAKAGKTGRAK